MEAGCSCETVVRTYQTIWCYNQRDHKKTCTLFVESFRLTCSVVTLGGVTLFSALQNKFYVEVTLRTSLQVQLLDLFRQKVADSRIDMIMGKRTGV
jgi:hypothetical protein